MQRRFLLARRSLCLLLGMLCFSHVAAAASPPEAPSRFHLWHEARDVLVALRDGTQAAFSPATLAYLLPVATLVGAASLADEAVQDAFAGHEEDDPLARAGDLYGLLYFGPVQAGLYTLGILRDDARLAGAGKRAFAALLGAQGLIQPLKYLTRRRTPDGASRLAFPSGHAGAISSILPTLYAEYGLLPAALAAASAGFIGFARLYGNAHHLSDVLAGYAIGLGWGMLVELGHRRQPAWTLLPLGDGRRFVGPGNAVALLRP